MRVLVLWAKHSATNLGIQALAAGAVELARMAYGADVEVTLHDHDTPGTPLGKSPILNDIGRRGGFVKELAREFDVVIDTGSGDSFTDIYGLRRLTVMTYVHRAVLRSGTPLVLAPQTLGPFTTPVGRRLGGRSLRSATIVASRDPESTRYSESLGRTPDVQSSDLVFALPTPTQTESRRSVFLNVSGLLWRENSHVDYQRYRSLVLDTARAVANGGTPVTLFPHVLRRAESREDDVTAAEEAWEHLGDDFGLYVPTSLTDVRQELANAKVVIGARMHACLNALSVGTPAIAWAYSRKFGPLLRDVGWDAAVDLRNASIDVTPLTLSLLDNPQTSAERAREVRSRAFASIQSVADRLRTGTEVPA